MFKPPPSIRRLRALLAAVICWCCTATAQETPAGWTDRETRLANEYLSLLVAQPEYGRVVDLLWALYDKHGATRLLLDHVAAQAGRSGHPTLRLVHGHLLRRSGDLAGAAKRYDEVLAAQPDHRAALRARAEAARELADPAGARDFLARLARLLPAGDPAATETWLELGTQSLAAGKTAEARAAWEKAASLRPDDFDLARRVADLLLRAGLPAEAAAFFSKLAQQSDPRRRLEAYHDLARIHELAGDFEQADAALTEGLALLDFRDGRYEEFFRRRVRLHERFGRLEELRTQLDQAATAQPAAERALRDLARFCAIVIDPDGQLTALRALVAALPGVEAYRWELVRLLLDHEGAQEAAKLLDERLKDGASPALLFLRCEADLRLGAPEAAAARLRALLEGADADLEKQALAFAQARALDGIVELILRRRVERDPNRQEAVFELAAFHRARKDAAAAEALLRRYIDTATGEAERSRRLDEAAGFLAAGQDTTHALVLAREQVARPDAGRTQWLRLADLLSEQGDTGEAATWLEKAWAASASDEERAEVDERLFAVLLGDAGVEAPVRQGTAGEFRLPDAFTGRGFAGVVEEPGLPTLPEAVLDKARELAAKASSTDAAALFRAAWWALRTGQHETAYPMLQRLQAAAGDNGLSLEADKLLLELALADQNRSLAERLLRRLIERDEAGRIRHVLRLSELLLEAEQAAVAAVQSRGWRSDQPVPPPGREAAELLEAGLRRHPDAEPLIAALAQCYLLQQRPDDAAALWREAIRRAGDSAAIPLMERQAELLLRQNQLAEYVAVQTAITERETDIKRRREAYKRFLDRLLWDSRGGELADEETTRRLDLVEKNLANLARKHPFDGFYHEALAQVYERKGDHARAFQAMKQAYYTAPDTPFSSGQLRDAALRVQDLNAAIYFQKQIAAAAAPAALATESRRLVELLEQTFQIAEADRVRRRLESRFAQDAASLESLAEHYRATGQEEAERRVYEQVARVRPWDARSQFRIALKSLRLADDAAAETRLREILAKTQASPSPRPTDPARLPLPLTDTRKEGAPGPVAELAGQVEAAAGLTHEEAGRLRSFFNLPRPELVSLPASIELLRLRAIEELARLLRRRGDPAELAAWGRDWQAAGRAPVERLWALFYAGDGDGFRVTLHEVLGDPPGLEARFCRVWLTLRSHGMTEALAWAGQTGLNIAEQEVRRRLLQAAVALLTDFAGFRYARGELAELGASRLLANAAVLEITRSLQDRQRYTEALELGESLRRNSPALAADYAYFLSRIAESAERWDLARQYLGQVVRAPARPGPYRGTYDPYVYSLATASRLAVSLQDREETLGEAWKHLQRTPDSAMTRLRKAVVAGLAGAEHTAAGELERLVTGDFVAARPMGEIRGILLPQGSVRHEEPQHLRSFWEETREIQAVLVQQGLGGVVQEANRQLDERLGNLTLSSRTGFEFGEWRLGHLLRRLRQEDYPTRRRLIREHLASVDMRMEVSVDTLSELGGRLESNGMAREAVEVYRMLPGRAPANPEYALWLLRVCEAARDTASGLAFTEQLLAAEPPMKPPQPGDEVLREKHAHFLAQNFDFTTLQQLGFRTEVTRVLQGRVPDEVPYLRELALLQERAGDDEAALAAWERLHLAHTVNAEKNVPKDIEACLRRARLLQRKGRAADALAALAEVDLTGKPHPHWRDVLALRASLLAEAGGWEEFRSLMALAVDQKTLSAILELARHLESHGRDAEALNYLIQAERSLRDDADRFRLRLEQLKLHSTDPDWTPELGRPQVAALFRARSRDREALQALADWMRGRAGGPQQNAWISVLRSETRAGLDRPAAALALAAFAKVLPDSAGNDLAEGWAAAREGDHACLELGAEVLLELGRPAWARQACETLLELPSLRLDGRKRPLMVRIAHALGDSAGVLELFAEVVRKSQPGGSQPVEWAQAFAAIGERGLARELFEAALDKNDGSQTLHAGLCTAWVRFLIEEGGFEAAEDFLRRHNWALPGETAELLVALYRAWGKLDSIAAELPKHHLPGGVEKEVLFLAARAGKLAPTDR